MKHKLVIIIPGDGPDRVQGCIFDNKLEAVYAAEHNKISLIDRLWFLDDVPNTAVVNHIEHGTMKVKHYWVVE